MRDTFLALPIAQKAATLAAAVSLLAMLILILASHQGQRQVVGQSSALFGESLVQQLARDASSPLVQGDKLSLQALLNELVESPLVVHGAVYDVENRAIAEAGDSLDGHDVSASITFQDSIAGYAVVTFDTQQLHRLATHQSWQLVALAVLLAALVYVVALYPGRQLGAIINDLTIVARTPLKRRRANTQVAYHGRDELAELADSVLAGPAEPATDRATGDYALLVFDIANLPSLRVNLGDQALASALATLHQQLKMICRLYDGELEASRSHCFSARFDATDNTPDYPFRALCAAFLIEQRLSEDDLPFHARQAIVINQSVLSRLEPVTGQQRTVEEGLILAQSVADGIVISERVYHHRSVEGRIDATDLGDGALRVEAAGEAYRQLLDRQLQTLRLR